ncbi:MAG: hypothetical protein ACSLEY_03430 [Candidatus Saccharimonadales bacterium]
MPDDIICSLVRAADNHGILEFKTYSDLKRVIGYQNGVKQLRKKVEVLYRQPSCQRPIEFRSPRIRQQDPVDAGDRTKHLIRLNREHEQIAILWKLRRPVVCATAELAVYETRRDILRRTFGVSDAEEILRQLIEAGHVQRTQRQGSKGKVVAEVFLLVPVPS